MAFPTIPTAAAGRVVTGLQANTTATRTFPSLSGLTKDPGDLLIAIVWGYQSSLTANIFGSWGAGFTEIKDIGAASQMCVGVAYKISDGTETGTFTVAQAGTVTGHAAFMLLSIPGAHATTPPEVSALLAVGTTAVADPAALNPAGWDAEDTLWISSAGSGETNTSGAYQGVGSAPTNYTDLAVTGISQDVVGGVAAGVGFRQLNAASEDVGPWSGAHDTSNARNAAIVIAVRPAGVTPITGTSAASVPAPTSSGTGSTAEAIAGTAAASIPAPSSTGTGSLRFTGTGASATPAPSASANGEQRFAGSGAGAVSGPTSSGTGELRHAGAAAEAVPAPTSSAAGGQTFTGSGAATGAAPSAAAQGGVFANLGPAAASVPAPSASAAGAITFLGTVAGGTLAPTLAGAGAMAFTGSAAASVPAPSSSGAGVWGIGGTLIAEELPAPTAAGSGTVVLNTAGELAATIAAPSSTAAGGVTFHGEVLAELPAPTATLDGGLGYGASGIVVVAGPTASATGEVTEPAAVRPGSVEGSVIHDGNSSGVSQGSAAAVGGASVTGTVISLGSGDDA